MYNELYIYFYHSVLNYRKVFNRTRPRIEPAQNQENILIEPALKFYPHLNRVKMCFELLKGMDIGQYAITSIIFQNELLDGKK